MKRLMIIIKLNKKMEREAGDLQTQLWLLETT
jgi:hypothetical protein